MPTVEAHVVGVQHNVDTGWYRIETDGDPKHMDTKIKEKAEDAAQLKRSGALGLLEYSEHPRTVDGRTYRNARLERAGEAEPASANGGGIETVSSSSGGDSGGYQRRKHPEERWQIALQGGMHAAVATIPHLPVEQRSFEHQKQIALAWADFLITEMQMLDEDPGRDPEIPSRGDDDIPFD